MKMISNPRLISRLSEIDWDFAGKLSDSAFSSIHWHPARFASQIPATFIGLLSKPGDLVVDPFMGSATTLVEAQRLGRRAIGSDLNPIACLIGRAKTLTKNAIAIGRIINTIQQEAHGTLSTTAKNGTHTRSLEEIPASVQVDKWYTKRVAQNLASLWQLVQSYTSTKRILGSAAFSAILLTVSRETRHWGYVCDNSTPQDEHEGNVLQEFCGTLDRLAAAYQERDADLRARYGNSFSLCDADVICGDSRFTLEKLPEDSVDLVVTSPPYFGVSDYLKAQRLSMEWFEHEIEPLRLKEIGARSKRHRKTALSDYIEECAEVFKAVRKCLRKGAYCVVVVGESATRRRALPQLRSSLESCGFEWRLDMNRRVSSQRRQTPSIIGENIFLLSPK